MAAEKITVNTVLLATATVIVVEMAARLVIARHWIFPMAALGLTRIVDVALLILIVQTKSKDLQVIGLDRGSIKRGLVRGIMWSAGFGAAAFAGMAVMYFLGRSPLQLLHAPLPETPGQRIAFFIVGVLIAPAAEELYFRGILYGYFRRWGVIPALVFSTVCFVMPHLSGNALPVTQILGGLVFTVSYELEKNLVVPYLIHSIGNLALFALPLLVVQPAFREIFGRI